jgi:hypothetical protein
MNSRLTNSILLLFLFSSLVFGGAVITDFRGEPGVNRVTLKWIVKAESNIKGYEVLRSMDGVNYLKIAFVDAKDGIDGEKTYTFIDKSVFKPTGNTFYYKIKFIELDDSAQFYDNVVVVSPQISSARHTWGSIKAMFR